MNNVAKIYVGVDISKSLLDVCIHPTNEIFKVANSVKGMSQFLQLLRSYNVQQIVCESSGGYEHLLEKTMKKSGYEFWPVDPRRIKAFIVSEGVKAKTDVIDARMIAKFASCKKRPYKDVKTSECNETLKEFVKRRSETVKMISAEKKRFKHPKAKHCKKMIKKHLAFLKKQLESIDKEIIKIIDDNDDFNKKSKIMKSMPGIGKVTAASLIANVPEIGKIGNKQIAALVGVAPFTKQSGTYKGIARIKDGRSDPRNALYMAALSASSNNSVFNVFYQKLVKKNKPKKVALVAVMRKMIVILNIMIKREEVWMPQNL